MKFKGTYGDLFAYSNDLNNFALEHPAVAKLLGGGYEKFEQRNLLPLDFMRKRLKELYEENVVKGADGKYETAGEDFNYKSQLHKDDFEVQWNRLMDLECDINIGYD